MSSVNPEKGCLLLALAHPDDEIGAVGTIAAHRALGVRVVMLFLSRGEMTESLGPLSAEEVGAARVQHAQEIARMGRRGLHDFNGWWRRPSEAFPATHGTPPTME